MQPRIDCGDDRPHPIGHPARNHPRADVRKKRSVPKTNQGVPASGDPMEGRRRLADLLARSAGKLLADVLNHFPLTRDDLERLGDVFAKLRKPGRAATGSWARDDDPLTRQMICIS